MAVRRVSSGLIPVSSGPEGLANSVHVLISNFSSESADVPLQVNRLGEENAKVEVRSDLVSVPAGGAWRVVLPDVAGEVIEVNLELPSIQVRPSIAIVTTAQSSDTSDLTYWISPDAFASVPSQEDSATVMGIGTTSVGITSGLLPVDRSGNGFAPDFQYALQLYISSFLGVSSNVAYSVNWAREVFQAKIPVAQATVPVPAGGAGALQFTEVEGRILEVNLELLREGLIPTLAVVRTNPEDGSTELIRWVAATEFARLTSPRAPRR